ncbi:uncharacterized protein LOC104584998 [Brachypodium distachyon]|uniref:uncharacterized protein LOC104584998 n=1 Tax=Brachypodium distachyon TaxID=15368 RepID=UPI00071D534B|nr:uncharacterized protein LOC104584998 [Brachypodium distachyon]|eukprot:XP_014757821.1 uncharacterized protein LOC104584998 [Brachypodium distachyon]
MALLFLRDPSLDMTISLKKYQANAKTCDIIFSTVSDGEFNKISNLTDAKKIWDLLVEVHEGTTTVKDSRVTRLISQFDRVMLEPNETVSSLYDRMSTIVNELNTLDDHNITDLMQNRRFFRALPMDYTTVCELIKHRADFKELTPTWVLGRIVSYELDQKEKRLIHGSGSSSKKNNVALKAKKSSKKIVSSSEESEESSSSDEESNDELALFVKRFNKKFGSKFENKLKYQGESSSSKFRKSAHRKNSDMAKRACFNCGKKGHFIAECPEKADEDKEKKSFKKHSHRKNHDRHKKKDWKKDSAHKKKDSSEDDSGDDCSSLSCFMAKSSKFIIEKQEDLLITEIKKNTNMANELKRLKSKFRAMEKVHKDLKKTHAEISLNYVSIKLEHENLKISHEDIQTENLDLNAKLVDLPQHGDSSEVCPKCNSSVNNIPQITTSHAVTQTDFPDSSDIASSFTTIGESCSVVTNPSPSDLSLAEENAKLKMQIEAGILKCHQGTETLNQILGLQIPRRRKDGIGFERKYNVNGDA